MLQGLLRKFDNVLRRPYADVLPLAVQVLHQGLSGLGAASPPSDFPCDEIFVNDSRC